MTHRIYKVEFKVPTGWLFVERNTADRHTTLRYVSYGSNCQCGSGRESGLNLSGGFEIAKASIRSLLVGGMIGWDAEWESETDLDEFIEAVAAAAFDLAKIADDKSSKISEPTQAAMDEVLAVFDSFYEKCDGPTPEQINSTNSNSYRKWLQEQRLVAIRAAGNLSNATFTKLRNQTEV